MICILGAEADFNLVPLASILDDTHLVVYAIQVYIVQNQERANLWQHASSLLAIQ